jgi:hypothetical protein
MLRTIGIGIFGALVLCAAFSGVAEAQQGHPLDGTWYGDWGPSPTHRNSVVLIIRYDGENLTGLLNPGPDSVALDVVTMDHTDWSVHVEADVRTFSGEVERYVIEGQLQDLGLPNRSMTGTWTHGASNGDFSVSRN